ncbi:MAG: DUF2497 domain-containing protein [Alphaproteobacteria bacterium]
MSTVFSRITPGVSDAFRPSRAKGLVYALLSGLVLSAGGLFLRAIETEDQLAVVAYRSAALGISMLAILAIRYGRALPSAFRAIGRTGLFGATLLGCGFSGYVLALMNTTIANALFVMSAGPIAAAALAWLLLREKVKPATWYAMAGTVAGVAVMVSGALETNGLFGIAMAAFAMVVVSGYAVVTRHQHTVDMLPALCVAGFIGAAIGALGAGDLALSPRDLAICLAMGGGQVMLGFMLLTLAARHAPAAEVTLVGLGEVIFGPILAWSIVGEVPAPETLVGGVAVLGSVLVYAGMGLKAERATWRSASSPAPMRPRDANLAGAFRDLLRQATERAEDPSSTLGKLAKVSREIEARESGFGESNLSAPGIGAPGWTEAVVIDPVATRTRDVRPEAELAPENFEGTIEQALHRALKPKLREWSEKNLEWVVERMVRDELRTLSRRGREAAAARRRPS